MCKRNRNANKESLKPHEYQIRKPIGVFTKIKCLKTENLQTGMNAKTEKPKIPVFPPPCICLFIRLITPPAKQIFNFLIKVVATNKQSEHREIPFFFPDFVSHHEFFFYYGTYRFFLRDREYFNL